MNVGILGPLTITNLELCVISIIATKLGNDLGTGSNIGVVFMD
jgi:hypothetical protein